LNKPTHKSFQHKVCAVCKRYIGVSWFNYINCKKWRFCFQWREGVELFLQYKKNTLSGEIKTKKWLAVLDAIRTEYMDDVLEFYPTLTALQKQDKPEKLTCL